MSFFSKIKDFLFLRREDRLLKAITKGDEKSVAELIRPKDCDSKRHDFMNHAITWGNQEIIKLLLDKGGFDINHVDKNTGDSYLHKTVQRKNESLVKFFIDKGVDINIINSDGVSALHQSIQDGKDNISQIIINSKNFNADSLNKNGNLLYECAVKSRYETTKLLLTKGFDLASQVKGDLTARELFALNDNSKDFLKETGNFSSPQDIDNFIATSKAKAILNLSYAEEGISMRNSVVNDLIKSSIIDKNFEKKDDILQTLDAISDKEKKIKLLNGNNLSIKEVSYEDHAAYFIFENDQNGKALKVTYCDGNALTGVDKNGYVKGAISFEIDTKKVSKFKDFDIWKHYLEDAFRCHSSEIYKDNSKNFYDIISKIAICDEKNNPIIDQQIPTKEQKRGNCTLKSIDIVIREVLRRSDESMVFENIDGKQVGKGYEIYKNYKNFLTEEPINQLVELSDKANEKDFGYQERLNILENKILPKAEKKGNDNLVGKIKNLFDKIKNAFSNEEEKDSSNEKTSKNNSTGQFNNIPTESPQPKEALQLSTMSKENFAAI